MRYIVSALKSEAKPIIDYLKLKEVNHQIFENFDTTLIISGIGKINSAIATTYILNRNRLIDTDTILNFGICGSTNYEKGKLLNINKIIDKCSDKVIHLKNTDGVTIICYDKPQNNLQNTTVDMESYGFYKASKEFIKLENIKLIKVVSDRISDDILSNKEVYDLILPHLKVIL